MKVDALKIRELGQLTVGALRDACVERGLPNGGRKNELISRLAAASPVRKSGSAFHSPPRVIVNSPSPRKDDRHAAPRRRLREKSPDPHRYIRSLDQSPGSPFGHRSMLSPVRAPRRRIHEKSPDPHRCNISPVRAPRRRIREKSPDPHRRAMFADTPSRGLLSSPLRPPQSPQLCRHTGSPNMLEPLAATDPMSLCRAPGTPGKRLRHKTFLTDVVAETSQDVAVAKGTLVEMGFPQAEAEAALQKAHGDLAVALAILLDAEPEGGAASSNEQCELERAESKVDTIDTSPKETSPSISVPSKRRLSGGIPLPPSSWTLEPEPDELEIIRDSMSLMSPECPLSPDRYPKQSQCSSPKNNQNLVVDRCPQVVEPGNARSPSPAATPALSPPKRDLSPDVHTTSTSEARSSNDWWRDVAKRWPKIIAKLRTGSNLPDVAPTSSRADCNRKRPQNVAVDFPSPKRHCSASICQSVPTPTRQPFSEFRSLD